MIEAGFGWMPSLGWRMDKNWKRLKDEVPHLKKAPSEYLRQHFWVSTQPMEEAEEPEHLIDMMSWVGWDQHHVRQRLSALGFRRSRCWRCRRASIDERRAKMFSENARALYRLD